MRERRVCGVAWFVPGTAALALGLLASLPAGAQAPVRVGQEFQVNSYTTSNQTNPAVAADAEGDFVVVWRSNGSSGTDTSSYSVQGQRYASDGSTQGEQFQVNTYTTSNQTVGSVAADSDGDFVVVWSSNGASEGDTNQSSVQGQRYASDGSAQGVQFQVNTYTTGSQSGPSVAADPQGDFVVVWQGAPAGIHGQRYASNGSAQGAQFQINTYTTGSEFAPSVASDADGDFVVAWYAGGSPGTDTSNFSVQGQRYASDGSPRGGQFQVNTYTTNFQVDPSVASDADGDFVVVWGSGSSGTDTSGNSVHGQRYASDGSARGAQFQVNTYTTNSQAYPSVVGDSDGDFVVVWGSNGSNGDPSLFSVQGQRYAADGSLLGAQFEVNTYTTSYQRLQSAATTADGGFVVVWGSNGSSGTDTSSYSVQGQQYRVPPSVPAMSPVATWVLGAALMLLGVAFARAYGSVSRRSRFSRYP